MEWIALESTDNKHYSVYVIELSKAVLKEHKFLKRNPNYIPGKICCYVGYTGLDPKVRFAKHMANVKSNVYVQKYGLRLLPKLYQTFNPMTHDAAVAKEISLGAVLQSLGFAVWQA